MLDDKWKENVNVRKVFTGMNKARSVKNPKSKDAQRSRIRNGMARDVFAILALRLKDSNVSVKALI